MPLTNNFSVYANRPRPAQHLIAATFAVMITLAFLTPFFFQHSSGIHTEENQAGRVITYLHFIEPAKTSALSPSKLAMVTAIKSKVPAPQASTPNKISATRKPENQLAFISPGVISTPASQSTDSITADEVPKLKIDPKSMYKAYQDSKTDMQKMVERSGKTLGDPTMSKYEKFQEKADAAVKPDCMAPYPAKKVDFLRIPIIIAMAITEHCK